MHPEHEPRQLSEEERGRLQGIIAARQAAIRRPRPGGDPMLGMESTDPWRDQAAASRRQRHCPEPAPDAPGCEEGELDEDAPEVASLTLLDGDRVAFSCDESFDPLEALDILQLGLDQVRADFEKGKADGG